MENMHDIPYLNRHVGPEIVAAMSVVCSEVRRVVQFIRTEGFVFSHIADEGTMNSDAGELLRYRKQIGADKILVFTDIKKKHR